MVFFDFITSPIGAQYTYAGMAITNALLILDIHLLGWLAKPPRNIVISSSVTLLTISQFFKVVVFLVLITTAGPHPINLVSTVIPWTRFLWFVVLVFLAPSVLNATYRIFRAMWKHTHHAK